MASPDFGRFPRLFVTEDNTDELGFCYDFVEFSPSFSLGLLAKNCKIVKEHQLSEVRSEYGVD